MRLLQCERTHPSRSFCLLASCCSAARTAPTRASAPRPRASRPRTRARGGRTWTASRRRPSRSTANTGLRPDSKARIAVIAQSRFLGHRGGRPRCAKRQRGLARGMVGRYFIKTCSKTRPNVEHEARRRVGRFVRFGPVRRGRRERRQRR